MEYEEEVIVDTGASFYEEDYGDAAGETSARSSTVTPSSRTQSRTSYSTARCRGSHQSAAVDIAYTSLMSVEEAKLQVETEMLTAKRDKLSFEAEKIQYEMELLKLEIQLKQRELNRHD